MPINTTVQIVSDIFIFKVVPTLTGFFAFMFGTGFLSALLVALFIKILLYFFEKEIKKFAFWLRTKIYKKKR